MSRRTSATIVALTSLAVVGFPAWAGPLNPPPGPVAGTHKTLTEVEPRTPIGPTTTPGDATATYIIGAPGCYYLTGNVTGQAGKDGIKVTANGPVTIDLNGFELLGVPASLNGFRQAGGNAIVGLYGGTIQGWGVNGLIADTGNHRVRDLVIRDNGGDGIHLTGAAYLEGHDLTLADNTGDGIEISGRAQLRNLIMYNGHAGLGVNILASATGVELDHVSISGNGVALSDGGTRTTVKGLTVNAAGVNAVSLVVLGTQGVTDGLVVHVSNSTFSGSVVDEFDVQWLELRMDAEGVSAGALAAIGANWDVKNLNVTAKNCTLSTALVVLTGDGSTVHGGSITAVGTTTAPAAVRIASNYSSFCTPEQFNLVPGIPIGIDVAGGTSNTISGANVSGVPSGGTGIRIAGGGNTVSHCRVSGNGTGAITGVALLAGSSNNLVVKSEFARLTGGTAVNNLGQPSNIIGPVVTNANLGAATNPFSNIQH